MRAKWLVLSAVAVIGLGSAGVALADRAGWIRNEQAEEAAFIREYPDALVYQGFGLFQQKDYRGAAEAWERYIHIAPKGADTVSIREMIGEARARAR